MLPACDLQENHTRPAGVGKTLFAAAQKSYAWRQEKAARR